jgi:rhodanese-related sulfurtransferase
MLGSDIPIELMRVKQVAQLLSDGAQVVLVDVRSRQEYLIRHIKGALSIPIDSIDARTREIPRDGLVVLYWACPHELASLAYKKLYAKGYRNLRVLDEGIPGWVEQGYPTEGWRASDDTPVGDRPSYRYPPLLRPWRSTAVST